MPNSDQAFQAILQSIKNAKLLENSNGMRTLLRITTLDRKRIVIRILYHFYRPEQSISGFQVFHDGPMRKEKTFPQKCCSSTHEESFDKNMLFLAIRMYLALIRKDEEYPLSHDFELEVISCVPVVLEFTDNRQTEIKDYTHLT